MPVYVEKKVEIWLDVTIAGSTGGRTDGKWKIGQCSGRPENRKKPCNNLVPLNTKQYQVILTQYHQVPTSTAP